MREQARSNEEVVGEDGLPWPQTFDGKAWAKEFVKHVRANPSIATDEDTMIGWFCNAIMVGYDRADGKALRLERRARRNARWAWRARGKFREVCESYNISATQLAKQLAAVTSERDRLQRQLLEYGNHYPTCSNTPNGIDGDCYCGWYLIKDALR